LNTARTRHADHDVASALRALIQAGAAVDDIEVDSWQAESRALDERLGIVKLVPV
jgi:hypothetical protein